MKKNNENIGSTGLTVLSFCLLTYIITYILRSCYPNPLPKEKEFAIKEYIEHPEYYEVKKIYEDTTLISYKVIYKK